MSETLEDRNLRRLLSAWAIPVDDRQIERSSVEFHRRLAEAPGPAPGIGLSKFLAVAAAATVVAALLWAILSTPVRAGRLPAVQESDRAGRGAWKPDEITPAKGDPASGVVLRIESQDAPEPFACIVGTPEGERTVHGFRAIRFLYGGPWCAGVNEALASVEHMAAQEPDMRQHCSMYLPELLEERTWVLALEEEARGIAEKAGEKWVAGSWRDRLCGAAGKREYSRAVAILDLRREELKMPLRARQFPGDGDLLKIYDIRTLVDNPIDFVVNVRQPFTFTEKQHIGTENGYLVVHHTFDVHRQVEAFIESVKAAKKPKK